MASGLRLVSCSAEFKPAPSEDRPKPIQTSPFLILWLTVEREGRDAMVPAVNEGYVLSWSLRLFLLGRTARELGKVDEPVVGQELPLGDRKMRFAFRLSLPVSMVNELRRLRGTGPPGQIELRLTVLEKATARPVEFVGFFEVGVERTASHSVRLLVDSALAGQLAVAQASETLCQRWTRLFGAGG
jgi:hypothetical protein